MFALQYVRWYILTQRVREGERQKESERDKERGIEEEEERRRGHNREERNTRGCSSSLPFIMYRCCVYKYP